MNFASRYGKPDLDSLILLYSIASVFPLWLIPSYWCLSPLLSTCTT